MKKLIYAKRVQAPKKSALDLAEVKCFLKVEHSVDDALLKSLIEAATEHCERYTGVALISQGWVAQFAIQTMQRFELPMRPLQKVDSLTAIYTSGVRAKYEDSHYYLDRDALVMRLMPSASCLEIVYTCGYGASDESVPACIKSVLMEHVAHLYEKRGTTAPFDLKKYDHFRQMKV